MKKKFFIGLFIFAAIGLFIFAHIVLRHNAQVEQAQQPALQAPIEIPETGILQLSDAVKTNKPVLVMFYVDWCAYCRRFMPIFSALSVLHKDKYTFAVVNCDNPENKELVEKYHIGSFPTLYIVDEKLDFEMMIHPMATVDKKVMDRELLKYLNLRSKVLK
ncbi:thioredoxin fold domain-containing protein [bacterium]|nr:thioredoxin fold domain-containing protein [bacterium]